MVVSEGALSLDLEMKQDSSEHCGGQWAYCSHESMVLLFLYLWVWILHDILKSFFHGPLCQSCSWKRCRNVVGLAKHMTTPAFPASLGKFGVQFDLGRVVRLLSHNGEWFCRTDNDMTHSWVRGRVLYKGTMTEPVVAVTEPWEEPGGGRQK